MTSEGRLEAAWRALTATASNERRAWHVPGRIEVLGKHTDYAGGRSLLCATSRGLVMVAAPRSDRRLRIRDALGGETLTLSLDASLPVARGSWARYPTSVARRLARDFPGLATGADLAFASDLPPAAGLSSSSALVVAVFTALTEWNRLGERADFRAAIPHRAALATYLGCIENGYSYGSFTADGGVGTSGGSEDHTAILCSRAGELARFSFCPVRPEEVVPMPRGHVFAVASSGVEAAKAGAARERYNRLSALAAHLARSWRHGTGGDETTLGEIAARPGAAEQLAALLEGAAGGPFPHAELAGRLEQFLFESEQAVPAAARSLAAGDLAAFGQWVERSVAIGARCLGNQIPETLALAAAARELGAVAASPFGGGFGGSVWALVGEDGAETFAARWLETYLAEFPRRRGAALTFLTPAAAGLRRLEATAQARGWKLS